MSKNNILPRQNYVFATGGARIELDSDAHADIDYDFFDSGGKTSNNKPVVGRPTCKVDVSSCVIDSNYLETVTKHSNLETDDSEDDDHVITNASGNLGSSENATSVELKTKTKGAVENSISLHGRPIQGCDSKNKLIAESVLVVNRSEQVNLQGDCKIKRNQPEAGEGSQENESDVNNKKPILQDPSQVKKKNLMNCIAYSSSPVNDVSKKPFVSCTKSQFETDNTATDSASSNTTSEITDVTSRASSSDYSLPRGVEMNNKIVNSMAQQGDHNLLHSQLRGMPMSLIIDPMRNLQIYEQRSDSRVSSSTVASKSSLGSSRSRILPARRNMSFTNDEMWRIERENECLLKKIEGKKNLHVKPQITPPNFNLSSSAINRRRVQMRIEQENQRLVKKLKSVRPVTNTNGNAPWRQVRY